MLRSTHPVELTRGSLRRNIMVFSLPLILSNLLQVLFNMSDVAVVGRFDGATALGSVGSCSVFCTLFAGLMIGLGGGINAIAARQAGAHDLQSLRRTVHSALIVSLTYGAVIMTVGLLGARTVLTWLGTKEELFDGALLYMRVYLIGMPALALYNYGNAVLSSEGDVHRPLLYLSAAGVVNILLNLFFVIVCHLGVLGVALASVISLYFSAALVLFRLFTCKEEYGLCADELHLDREAARTVLALGIPAALQNAIFAVANLFVQSAVNSFDTVIVEGNAAAANADGLIYDMMAAFYAACTTFMAQNYGAGKKERVLQSYFISLFYSFLFAAVGSGLLFGCGRSFLALFTEDPAVAEAGMKRLSIMAFSYPFSAFMDCTIAASRGLGKTVVPTVLVILGSCVFRVIWVYTVFAYFRTIPSLYLLYLFSWAITAIFEIVYFVRLYRRIFPRRLCCSDTER